MGTPFHVILFMILSCLTITYGRDCNAYTFTNNNVYSTCVTLPSLNSQLHSTYHPSNTTADVAYRQSGVSNSQWVAWGLNVNGAGMVGAQTLVGLVSSNGSVQAYTSSVNGFGTSLQPGGLSFAVSRIRGELVNGDVVVYASLSFPSSRTSFAQVWQVGPVSDGAPVAHQMGSVNRNVVGRVDFATGETSFRVMIIVIGMSFLRIASTSSMVDLSAQEW